MIYWNFYYNNLKNFICEILRFSGTFVPGTGTTLFDSGFGGNGFTGFGGNDFNSFAGNDFNGFAGNDFNGFGGNDFGFNRDEFDAVEEDVEPMKQVINQLEPVKKPPKKQKVKSTTTSTTTTTTTTEAPTTTMITTTTAEPEPTSTQSPTLLPDNNEMGQFQYPNIAYPNFINPNVAPYTLAISPAIFPAYYYDTTQTEPPKPNKTKPSKKKSPSKTNSSKKTLKDSDRQVSVSHITITPASSNQPTVQQSHYSSKKESISNLMYSPEQNPTDFLAAYFNYLNTYKPNQNYPNQNYQNHPNFNSANQYDNQYNGYSPQYSQPNINTPVQNYQNIPSYNGANLYGNQNPIGQINQFNPYNSPFNGQNSYGIPNNNQGNPNYNTPNNGQNTFENPSSSFGSYNPSPSFNANTPPQFPANPTNYPPPSNVNEQQETEDNAPNNRQPRE